MMKTNCNATQGMLALAFSLPSITGVLIFTFPGGPPRYSEIRINVAQAFNGIGTVVAPVLASYVFFKNTGTDQNALESVQWTYLAIACFVFLLAVVYFFSPIPEITGK
jgi:fucose permease